MPISENDIDLIARYLQGDMPVDEQSAIEAKAAASEDFSKELSFQRRLIAHIQAEEKTRLKAEMLKDFRAKKKEASSKKWPRRWIQLAVAASIFLMATFYFVLDSRTSSNEVFLSHFQVYDGVVIVRGEDHSISEGLRAYNRGDFSKALDIFLALEAYEISDGQLYLLVSSCFLKLNEPEKALEWLTEVQATEEASIVYNQQWYLALTMLSLDRLEDSKILLQQITASPSIYAAEASTLLDNSIFK